MCGYSYAARAALINIQAGTIEGETDMATLLSIAEQTNSMDWMYTVTALASLGTNARPAIPTLCRVIDSAKVPEVFSAVQIVGAVRIEAKQCVPALIHCFERGQTSPALSGLGLFGESARPAIPTLRKHLHDPDPLRRQSVRWTLERIMGKQEFGELVKLQEQAANDSDSAAIERAVKALEEIDRKAAAAPMVDEME